MPVRLMDISNHQSPMDVARVIRENGFDAVIVLTNDGTFVNQFFSKQIAAAREAGALVAAYTYLRPNWAQTIDVHLSMTPPDVPSIVDVEDGSGGWAEVWAAHNRLWDAGRDTPLLYWPNFHWQSVGSPDLTPLAARVRGLWKSWYPDNTPRAYDDAYARVPSSVWNDTRGGIPVRIVQFTGTGRVNGYGGNVDLNYFPGSRDELATLLGGGDDVSAADDVLYNKKIIGPNGATPYNLNDMVFWTNFFVNELVPKVDALSSAVAKIAEADHRVQLDPEQLAVLTEKLSDRVGSEFDQVDAKLQEIATAIAQQAGADQAVVLAALRQFFRPAVDPAA